MAGRKQSYQLGDASPSPNAINNANMWADDTYFNNANNDKDETLPGIDSMHSNNSNDINEDNNLLPPNNHKKNKQTNNKKNSKNNKNKNKNEKPKQQKYNNNNNNDTIKQITVDNIEGNLLKYKANTEQSLRYCFQFCRMNFWFFFWCELRFFF